MTKQAEARIDKRKEKLMEILEHEGWTEKEREEYDSLPETTKDKELHNMIDEQNEKEQKQRIHNLRFNKQLYALEVELPLDYFTPFNIRQIKNKGFIKQQNNLFILSFPLEEDRYVWNRMIRMNLVNTKYRELNKKHIIKEIMVENHIRKELVERDVREFKKHLDGWLGIKL